ncbi:TlpA family protein disulfide reductase [Seonamhaeicola algicola]|uniref:TlpA family protein disulfide reductase n=1 Tax=Seonamhaeicola algicola TaxID=1719036 RepID=A0A5C7AX64_9FLAO|nr:TlpA disulfide reductase family protein [Seonamhaeicola algicola]TXE13121.1 TlpA family protein disulfide reductase [Seonamhaeicola algicola]
MKKLLLAFSIAFSVVACKQTQTKPVDYIVISGKIDNSNQKNITLTSDLMFDVNPNPKHSIKISEDGTFRDTLNILNGIYWYAQGNNKMTLHLYNGANLSINYNANNFKNSLKLNGEGSGVAKYHVKKDSIVNNAYKNPTGNASIFSLQEANFISKINSIKASLETALSNTDSIPNSIKNKEKRAINYQYIDFIARYKNVYPYLSKDSTYTPSKTLTKTLDTLTYDRDEDFMFSRLYQYQLFNFYKDITVKNTKKNNPPILERLKVYNTIPSEFIKNKMLFYETNTGLPREDVLEPIYNYYATNATNETDKATITKLYNELKVLSKGQPSPTFENYENHAGGSTSLKDFKGKYVYIDVWATWCGPCKYEIPFLEKVEKEFHNKNIAFVSISVDTKKAYNTWKNMVTNNNMGGVQLLADKAFNSKFIKDYKVNGIPKFILIDPNGNIVSANAPRPSSKEIRPLLNTLLN